MSEFLEKNKVLVFVLVALAVAVAAISAVRTFKPGSTKMPTVEEALQQQQAEHQKLQQELQQKYGVRPAPFGMPGGGGAGGQIPGGGPTPGIPGGQ